MNCTQAKAAVEAVRADIEANGPDALRDLLRQTDALLGRMTHWTKCQRAARYRSLLVAYAASRQAEPPRHEDTKNPNENHAQLREAPGAARSSLPSVPPCPGGSPIPDSRDFASIRGGYDLVIPLGTGSRHDNLELRHLLRSALLHLDSRSLASIRGPSLRRIHIIGPQRPAWLADHPMIRWHQWKTLKPKNHDIVAKFIHAANHPDVAETFIGTCDDFLFLAPLLIEPQSRSERDKSHARPADGGEDTKNPNENPTQRREAPGAARLSPSFAPSRLSGSPIPDLREFASIRGSIHYGAVRHGGVLSTATDQGYWKNAQAQTRRLLDAAGYPHLFYDYHVPTVMTKTGWQKVAREIPWRSLPGHAVWSLYHNVAGVHGPVLGPDSHTGYHAGDGSRFPRTPDEIDRAAAGKLFLTYNDGGLQGGVMQTWLETHHPTPAPWEIVDREHAERADAPARSPGFSPLPSPGENPAQRREAPGAARLSLPFVPSCPGGSPVPDSRSSASIRGSLPSSPSWSSSLRGDEFLLCSFNTPYADYAAACIHSILSTNPGYTVHAFPTNVPADILAQYPFAHPAVVLPPETRPFKTPNAERNYMVCRRYVRYAEFIETQPDGPW
ncbi:MAG: hypothetical protein RBU25_06275, partial [Lentisphaeria bacterium]|nr:hypothetical protein [Lentisphaeria bacterium]